MYDIVLYHAGCADGFTAAWAARGALPTGVECVPVSYTDKDYPDVTDKHVLIVDFSYDEQRLREMVDGGCAKTITILDHHKTAQEELSDFIVGSEGEVNLDDPDVFATGCRELAVRPIRAWFDMERSGCQLVWSYFYGGEEVELIKYVGNRDLWRLDALPGIREAHAWLMSHEFDFDVWNTLQYRMEEHMSNVIEEGSAILRAHDRNLRQLLESTRRTMIIGGHTVPVANLPYTMASDGAGAMAAEPGVEFAATYYDNSKGQRVFSLRSNKEHGIDVSAIAKQYGGGGHRNAAGFSVDHFATGGGDGIEVVGASMETDQG